MNDLISRQAAIAEFNNCELTPDGGIDVNYAIDFLEQMPSAQPSVSKTEIIGDTISRQAAIDSVRKAKGKGEAHRMLIQLPPAQPEQRWIPFKTRPLTKEEKEEHPEWDGIFDCKLPDDGQRILVSVSVRGHESVQYDEFYTDDGSYLDSGYEIGTEATAWMPLPKPWEGDANGKN